MMNSFAKSEHARVSREIEVRFYAELNDFLPPEKRQRAFNYVFTGTPSVKDTIEAIGVPHTEIDVILVDGESVGFKRLLTGGERVAVDVVPQADQILNRNTGGCRRGGHLVPSPWLPIATNLALIFLEFKLQLALSCQLYLIAATQTRAKLALVAGDERELRLPSWLSGWPGAPPLRVRSS